MAGFLDVYNSTYNAPPVGAEDPSRDVSWSDYGRAAVAGTQDVGGLVASFGRYVSEQMGDIEGAAQFSEAQRAAGTNAQMTTEAMGEAARARLEASVTSSDFWEHPVSSGMLKLTRSTPAMAAAVLPALVMPEVAGLMLGGGALGAAQSIHDITDAIDKIPDDQLKEKVPRYAALRDLYDEKQARVLYDQDLIGMEPIINGVVGGLANVVGPGAKLLGVARRAPGALIAPEAGIIRRGLVSGAEGAAGGAAQGAVQDVTSQNVLRREGVQEGFDEGRLANAILEPALLGAGAGLVGGAFGRARPAERAPGAVAGAVPRAEAGAAAVQAPPATGPSGTSRAFPKPAQAAPTEVAPETSGKSTAKDTRKGTIPGEVPQSRPGAPGEPPEGAGPARGGVEVTGGLVDSDQATALKANQEAPAVPGASTPASVASGLEGLLARAQAMQDEQARAKAATPEAAGQRTQAPPGAGMTPEQAAAIAERVRARGQPVPEEMPAQEPVAPIRPEPPAPVPGEPPPRTGRVLRSETPEAVARGRAWEERNARVLEQEAQARQMLAEKTARIAREEEAAAAEPSAKGEPAERKGKISKAQKGLFERAATHAGEIWEARKPAEDEDFTLNSGSIKALKQRLEDIFGHVAEKQKQVTSELHASDEYKNASKSIKADLDRAAQVVPKRISDAHTTEQLMLRQAMDLRGKMEAGKKLPQKFIRDFRTDEFQARHGEGAEVRARRLVEGEAAKKPKGEAGAEGAAAPHEEPAPAEHVREGELEPEEGVVHEPVREEVAGREQGRIAAEHEGEHVGTIEPEEHETADISTERVKPVAAEPTRPPSKGKIRIDEVALKRLETKAEKGALSPDEVAAMKRLRKSLGREEVLPERVKPEPVAEPVVAAEPAPKINRPLFTLKKKATPEQPARERAREISGALHPHKYLDILNSGKGPRSLSEGGTTMVSEGQINKLATYRATDILRMLDTQDIKNPVVRQLFGFVRDKMVKALGDTKLHFISEADLMLIRGGVPDGLYNYDHDHIIISEGILDDPHRLMTAVMHEAVHGLTMKGISLDGALIGQIVKLQNIVGEHIGELPEGHNLRYGLYDPTRIGGDYHNAIEFIAEAFGNKDFAERLAGIKLDFKTARELGVYDWRAATVWDGFKGIVRRALSALGILLPRNTALEAALGMTERASHERLPVEGAKYHLNILERGTRDMTPAQREDYAQKHRLADMVMGTDDLVHQNMLKEDYARVADGEHAGDVFEHLSEAPAKAAGMLGDAIARTGKFASKWLTTPLQHAYMVRNMFNEFDPVELANTVERMGVRAHELRREGEPLLADMIRAKKDKPEAFGRLNDLMYKETMFGADASSELGQGRNRNIGLSEKAKKKIAAGRTLEDLLDTSDVPMSKREAIKEHGALKREYDELVRENPEFAKMHEDMLKYYENVQRVLAAHHVEMALGDVENFHGDPKAKAQELLKLKMTEDNKAMLRKEYGDAVAEEIIKASKMLVSGNGPYIPLIRHGDYAVTGRYKIKEPIGPGVHRIDDSTYEFDTYKQAVKFADESGLHHEFSKSYYNELGERTGPQDAVREAFRVKVQREHVSYHESMAEARARHGELQASGLMSDLAEPAQKKLLNFMSAAEISYGTEASILKKLEQTPEYLASSASERAALRQSVKLGLTSMLEGNRIQHRRMPRRRVAGAREDLIRDFAAYNNSTANYRARQELAPEVNRRLRQMDEEVKAREYEKGHTERMAARNQINEFNEASARDPVNSSAQRAVKVIQTASWIDRMARPSHLILQNVHFPLITGPIMAARHGLGAFSEFYKVWSKLGPLGSQLQGFKEMVAAYRDPSVHGTDFIKKTLDLLKDDPDHARLVELMGRLKDIGRAHADSMQEVERLMPMWREGIMGKSEAWLSKTDAAFRHAASVADNMTRTASAVAAYRLEFAKLTREGRTADAAHQGAMRYTEKVLHDTQGHFSATNRAGLWRTPVGRALLQFKQFSQMFYHLWATTLKDVFQGESREAKFEAMRKVALLAGSHALMAGTVGMVPFDVPRILINTAGSLGLTDFDWGDIEKWEREKLYQVTGSRDAAEYMTHGILRGFGVDVVSRLGVGDLLTYGLPGKDATRKDWTSYLFEQIGGAPSSLVGDAFKGLDEMATGDAKKGAAMMVPSQMLRDVKLALEGGQPGEKGYKYTAGERVARALGFTPAGQAQKRERTQELRQEIGHLTKTRSQLVSKYVDADPGERANIEYAITKWNYGKPKEAQISRGDLVLAKARHAAQKAKGNTIDGVAVTSRTRSIAEAHRRLYGVTQ